MPLSQQRVFNLLLYVWIIIEIVFLIFSFAFINQISHLSFVEFIISHIVGICIATVVMYIGVGGGILWVPFYVTWMKCTPLDGVYLSIFTQIFGKGSGTVEFIKAKMINWDIVRFFIPYAFIGIFFGYLAGFVISKKYQFLLLLIFAIVILILLITMLRSFKDVPSKKVEHFDVSQSKVIVIVASFFTGLLSIGNSDWLIPYQERYLGIPLNKAVANGIVLMFFCAFFFLILMTVSVLLGFNAWPVKSTILLGSCSGTIIGGQIGSRLTYFEKLRNNQKHVFIFVLTMSALHMIYEFVTKFFNL